MSCHRPSPLSRLSTAASGALLLGLALTGCGSSADASAGQPSSNTSVLKDAYTSCSKSLDDTLTSEYQGATNTAADFLVLGDGGRSLTVTQPGEGEIKTALSEQVGHCVLGATHAPDSVVNELEQTTAMMGRQHAAWSGIKLSYSFHPQSGLAATFTSGE